MKNEKYNFGFEIKAINDRADDNGEEFHVIEGILSTNSIDSGNDIVETKAILESVEEYGLPKFLHQHDGFNGMPLGIVTELKAVDNGIYIKTEVLKGIKFNDDIVRKAKHGEYGGLSIGYRTLDADFAGPVRVIKKLKLKDASLVVYPMNEEAVLTSIKSIEGLEDLKSVEASLREHGYSKKSCEAIISKIKSFSLGDQVEEDEGEPCANDDGKEEKNDEQNLEIKNAFVDLINEMKTTR